MADYVRLRQVRETNDMAKFIATVLPGDLLDTLRQVSAYELQRQVQGGNKPSAIIVDGTNNKPMASAARRVQSLFSDTANIAAALRATFALLDKLTRHRSGAAQGSYQLLLNDRPSGNESWVDRVAAKVTARDNVTVIGPMVGYGRKLYWNPATGGRAGKTARLLKKTRFAIGQSKTGRLSVVRVKTGGTFREPLHRAAARILNRQFPALTIKEAWPKTAFFRALKLKDKASDPGTPGVMIRFKKGRTARGY